MPKLAANLSMLFNELPFIERFSAAANFGFKGVEYLFPYAFDANELKAELDRNHLKQVLFNLPAGDWDAGDRGIAADPSRIDEFRAGVSLAIEYAKVLGCEQVNCLAGIVPAGVSQEAAEETLIENLKFANDQLEKAGIRLVIEAINTRDIPGFALTNTRQALRICDAVGSENLSLQYDIYHMQIMEGDIAPTLKSTLSRIGHIQIADNPGRHEPGTGELNYHFLFRYIDEIGYQGWVGCEYKPATTTEEGLKWLVDYNQNEE
ncbi:hydroxypyruvate isomerase [Enterovibrio paralichthyis]|uniref:hydroxypyruvate isomerase n=1 Tax=Enterovibrio paralichthyis TaxID=2853805 RepID=UPI001C4659F7|nr:hydroxypyruvate isomerase [Enterovibrio paralichthyis]MBV7299296.1 hydroxypyruvate isomerase [Enterovibrio paralichthyis]